MIRKADQSEFDFDGDTYDPALDKARLNTQYGRVFELMSDGRWYTLAEIQAAVGGTMTGVSARYRDFKKPEKGGFHTEKRRRGDGRRGLWEYRLDLTGRQRVPADPPTA